ncbi:MAG: [NiFe]-hydrogenase assembly chaperone HybE [Pseudomonadota bacterium]|nr:[NiFe]-hydrogenase assembly chaperone HybE [Pseudomonadota bacterium]
MTDPIWEIRPPDLSDEAALAAAVLDVHREILQGPMAGDPGLNLNLRIQQRALRKIECWRVLLLLTPWMLSRLLFPDEPPSLPLLRDWSARDRRGKDYLVLGPHLSFELLGQRQQAHLSYHPRLGHYLLQPICLNMQPYGSADAVFEQWNQVIHTRDENMEKAKRDCPLQKEVSRREFFRRLKAPDG